MSLVSEALKKAQRDAALRDARAKGLPEPLVTGAQPFRARRGSLWPLWALAGALALVLVLAIFLFLGRPEIPVSSSDRDASTSAAPAAPTTDKSSPREAPASRAAPETSAAAAPSATEKNSPTGEPVPAAAAEAVAAESGTAAAPGALRPAQPTSAAPASPSAGPASGPTPPSMEASGRTTAAPSPGSPPAAPPPGQSSPTTSFVRTAKLADGVEIRLGGIAWSEVTPLAYLNGRLLGVGESVGAWRVARIERDRVRLERGGEQVTVSLR